MDAFKVWVPLREHLSVQVVWYSNCFIVENLRKAKFHIHGILKPQNTKTSPYKLSLSFCSFFFYFWVRQKKITIHSLSGSPCTIEYNTLQYNAMPDGFETVWKMGNDLEKSGWS